MSYNQNDPQEKEVFEDCSDGENNKDTAAPEEEEEEIEEIYVNAEEDYKKALGFKNEGNKYFFYDFFDPFEFFLILFL